MSHRTAAFPDREGMVRCIHITPELPPTVGGIADYVTILSQRLEEVSGGSVDPILVHAGREQTNTIDVEFPVEDLSGKRSAVALSNTVSQLASDVDRPVFVLLEYSGYGYSWRGAPLWLLRGLREVCRSGKAPLVTVFHELYASSARPWEKTFWTMPLQYIVVRGLARLSSGLVTNRRDMLQQLSGWVSDSPVRLSPTFSNVGEPSALPEYEDRDPYAVHFGGPGRKAEAYKQWGGTLDQALRRAEIERVIDIGSQCDIDPHRYLETPVEYKGILPADRISTLLRSASIGILRHPLHCLTKSGVWAAYAAHGVPPLILTHQESSRTEFEENDHSLTICSNTKSTTRLSSVSKNVKQWYNENATSVQSARKVVSVLSELKC